jgi:hypothetical protein
MVTIVTPNEFIDIELVEIVLTSSSNFEDVELV